MSHFCHLAGCESPIAIQLGYLGNLKNRCFKNSFCSLERLVRNPFLLNEKPSIPLEILDITFFFINVGVKGWNSIV